MDPKRAKNVTNHSFRHMFITRIAKEKGCYIGKLRAGHKSVTNTERYIHYNVDDMLKEEHNGKKTKINISSEGD
jgi:integrase